MKIKISFYISGFCRLFGAILNSSEEWINPLCLPNAALEMFTQVASMQSVQPCCAPCCRILPLSAWTQMDKSPNLPFQITVLLDSAIFFYHQVLKVSLPSARATEQHKPLRTPSWGVEKTAKGTIFLLFFSAGVAGLVLVLAASWEGREKVHPPPPPLSLTRPVSVPFQLCKHCWPLPQPNSTVCLPDKFVLFIFFNLAAQRSFVIHKDGFPGRSSWGFHPSGTRRPAESLTGALNVSEDDKFKCNFL